MELIDSDVHQNTRITARHLRQAELCLEMTVFILTAA